jgi:hypothetical protein
MTDKEQLRKEFANVLREGIKFSGQVGDYLINETVFEYLESKLESKDTLLESLASHAEGLEKELRQSERIRQSDWNELNGQIADLKEELTDCNQAIDESGLLFLKIIGTK